MSVELPVYTIEKRGTMWLLHRPATEKERRIYGIPENDPKPMGVLGISSDGYACIAEEEDARLIVAAPDLLASLESLWEHCVDQGWIEADSDSEAVAKIRSAIAKAKGEE